MTIWFNFLKFINHFTTLSQAQGVQTCLLCVSLLKPWIEGLNSVTHAFISFLTYSISSKFVQFDWIWICLYQTSFE